MKKSLCWLIAMKLNYLLVVCEEFFNLVFVDHYFLVGIFSSNRVFDALNNFYEVPSGSGICRPLGNPRVLRYLCHDYLISR